MKSLNILETDLLRNFIYDRSCMKLLIGSRRIGKTSTLVLDAFMNVYMKSRNTLFIVNNENCLEYVQKIFMSYCKEYDVKNITRISRYIIKINNNFFYMTSEIALVRNGLRGISVMNVYIDEPDFMMDFDFVIKTAKNMTLYGPYKDVQIAIAGSFNKHTNILKELNNDKSFSKYIYKATDILDENELEIIKRNMSEESFRTEILCEAI